MRWQRLGLVLGALALAAAGQTAATISAPAAPAQPGVYVLAATSETTPWVRMHSIEPSTVKAETSALSTLAGLTTTPTLAEFIGAEAQVQTSDRKPVFCINQLDTSAAPLLVRLQPKKKKNRRDLDVGAVHAALAVGASLEQASNSAVVPINEAPRGDGCDLLQPDRSLATGEYAIMLGSDNLTVYAFGVQSKGR